MSNTAHSGVDPKKLGAKPSLRGKAAVTPWNRNGIEKDMEEQPDHGERTYQGLDRLRGKAVLITGGDSGIGKAVAIAYAREGADVALSYLPAEEGCAGHGSLD
jgi:hypothetical protein